MHLNVTSFKSLSIGSYENHGNVTHIISDPKTKGPYGMVDFCVGEGQEKCEWRFHVPYSDSDAVPADKQVLRDIADFMDTLKDPNDG